MSPSQTNPPPPSYTSLFTTDLHSIFSRIENLSPRFATQQVLDSASFEHHLSSAQILVKIDKLNQSGFRKQKADLNSTDFLIQKMTKTLRFEHQRAGLPDMELAKGDRIMIGRIERACNQRLNAQRYSLSLKHIV
jgi:hypothetical protein